VRQEWKHSRMSEANACSVLARYEIQFVFSLKAVPRWLGNEREQGTTADGTEQPVNKV
jgi:hypothetical protein